jgi:hypothetical protein
LGRLWAAKTLHSHRRLNDLPARSRANPSIVPMLMHPQRAALLLLPFKPVSPNAPGSLART